MDVVAKLRFYRVGPRKVRLVLDLIRGKNVQVAEAQLMHLPKGSALPILKLLKSAEANAEHNFKLDPKTLYIKQAFADEGPKLKRYFPRAFGRAALILKRSSHITLVLGTKEVVKATTPTKETPAPKLAPRKTAARKKTSTPKTVATSKKVKE